MDVVTSIEECMADVIGWERNKDVTADYTQRTVYIMTYRGACVTTTTPWLPLI